MVFEIDNYASLREATEKINKWLTEQNVSQERLFDIRLVMSELVGNVLRHAKTVARLGGRPSSIHLCSHPSTEEVPLFAPP